MDVVMRESMEEVGMGGGVDRGEDRGGDRREGGGGDEH